MPLVRFEVRNEYGMGDPELYRAAVKKEEPKAILDGLSVAGLVGILRQLGDMAEFAADIFHDLHEEVIATSARGRKVMTRVRNIEVALPSLEKAVKGQTSHIHLAYIPGCDWHARVRTERSHLLSSDLPRFMMDSYEECRDPPRLYLLDKFDNGGSGTCLKRYSDPTFFQKAWDMLSKVEKAENAHRENNKYNKIKRKGSHGRNSAKQHSSNTSNFRNGTLSDIVSSQRNISKRFTSANIDLQSISDHRSNPDMISRSTSFGSSSIRHEETNGESINVLNFMKPNISPGNLPLPLSLMSGIKREESVSETDNYADALNTLDSETEMETENECCTKWEVHEPTVTSSNDRVLNESSEISQIGPSEHLLNDSERFKNGNGDASGSENTFIKQQSPEISLVAPPANVSSQEIKFVPTDLKDNFVVTEISSSDLDNESPRVRIKPRNAPQFSENSPLVVPNLPSSPKIKPNVENTILDEPRASSVESCKNGETISKSEVHTSILNDNSDFDAKIGVQNNAPFITDENKPPAKLWTNAGLFGLQPSKPPVFEKDTPNGAMHNSNLEDNANKLTNNSTPNGVPRHTTLNETTETIATHNLTSSFSSLAQRFLTNSLQRGIISSSPLSCTTNNTPSTDNNITKSNEPKLAKSSDGSSSPPLEYMKIFIHPSNRNPNPDSNEDLSPNVPDIQILPGPYFQNESDSDEDTFCRSYAYSSDDQLSPVRNSTSDVWDQDKVITTDLPGIESVVFAQNRSQGEYNEYFNQGDLSENQVNEYDECFNQRDLSEDQVMPPPPPLPPAQWRVVNNKPSISSSVERPSVVPLPPSFSTALLQPKFSKKDEKSEKNEELKGTNTGKEVDLQAEVLQWHTNKLDQQKLNGHDKPKEETFDAKDLEEREDLLDQIRKKSFNLRRTLTSKPNPDSSQTATSSSVSAILEKANAIRQAFVGSDDGCDDDGWSDV